MLAMKLIVGLGNPGNQYQNTKHNIGFVTIDKIATKLNVELKQKNFNGLYYKDKDVILLKPMTFMNNSGQCVSQVANYFKIKMQDILIIADDIDNPIGKIVIRTKGSSGGQNGLKSIFHYLNTQEISRIKIGIDRPQHSHQVSDYVLSPFLAKHLLTMQQVVDLAANAALEFIKEPIDKVITKYNGRKIITSS